MFSKRFGHRFRLSYSVLPGGSSNSGRTRERFVDIKREIVTSAYYNDIALLLHALGCLNLHETFAGWKPR
jgi:hypothetical protein